MLNKQSTNFHAFSVRFGVQTIVRWKQLNFTMTVSTMLLCTDSTIYYTLTGEIIKALPSILQGCYAQCEVQP